MSVSVNDIIRRLQDVMANGDTELVKHIGGVVDLDTMLEKTSITPISFHVSYAGSAIPNLNVMLGYPDATIVETFIVYVVIGVKHLNGRSAQAMIPTIKNNLLISLFGWEVDDEQDPFGFTGDSVEYSDAGRYVHSFAFTTTSRIEAKNVEIDSLITPFDSFYADIIVGKDEDGNDTIIKAQALNIYNDGEPL